MKQKLESKAHNFSALGKLLLEEDGVLGARRRGDAHEVLHGGVEPDCKIKYWKN